MMSHASLHAGPDLSVYTALGVLYFVHKSLVGLSERFSHKQGKYIQLDNGNHVVVDRKCKSSAHADCTT